MAYQEYAYITGAASGIGREIARFLRAKGVEVFLADMSEDSLGKLAEELKAPSMVVDVTSWESQERGFRAAAEQFGRVDYVFPIAGIGQKQWLPSTPPANGSFVKPELGIMDVNITGMLWTIALGVQQFRRQGIGENGFRGKVLCPGSVCGIYTFRSSPLYSMSKHAVSGLVRSMGDSLPTEKITMNAFCPAPIQTAFSSDAFYKLLEDKDLLTPMAGVLDTVDKILGSSDVSGQLWEIGPNYAKGQGHVVRTFPEFADADTERVFEMLDARGLPR